MRQYISTVTKMYMYLQLLRGNYDVKQINFVQYTSASCYITAIYS